MTTPILTIDTESTGPNPLSDRLLTIFVGIMGSEGEWVAQKHMMFNPGVPIPSEVTEIHGISEEKAAAEGVPVAEAKEAWTYLRSIIVNSVRDRNLPVVAYNAVFDFTLINQELKYNGLPPISWDDMFIIDPMIVDKHIDPWRKGSRKLVNAAGHYGVNVDDSLAHDASYDCYLVGKVVQSQKFRDNEELQALSRSQLHEKQKEWKREQCAHLETYLRKKNNDPHLIVDPAWPERFVDLT